MAIENFVTIFENHFSFFKKVILNHAMWECEPSKKTCEILNDTLSILSKNGNKKAAALYCLIAAYDNNANCFDKDMATQFLVDLDAFDEYWSLVREEFEGIVDDETFVSFLEFPIINMLENLSDTE